MTKYVAGYSVLDLPVPRSEGVDFAVGDDGQEEFAKSVSSLSVSPGMSVPTTPESVRARPRSG
jgi:hypothetical protein